MKDLDAEEESMFPRVLFRNVMLVIADSWQFFISCCSGNFHARENCTFLKIFENIMMYAE